MSKRLLLLAIALLLVTAPGRTQAAGGPQKRDDAPRLQFADLDKAGMALAWDTTIYATKGKPRAGQTQKEKPVKIRKVYFYDNTILVESADKWVYSFDRKTGAPDWVTSVPDSLQIIPTLYDRRYWTVAAGRLTVIDSKGVVTIGPLFPVSLSAPLLVTDDYFYAAAASGGIYKLDKKELQPVWPAPARTEGVILGKPLIAEDLLLFASSSGEVAGVDFITSARRIYKSGLGKILGGIVSDGANFYFGSNDFYVYSYTILGSPAWHTMIQEQPSGTPILLGDSLYVDSMGGGLWALAKADGSVVWYNSGVGANLEWLPVAQEQDEAKIKDIRSGTPVPGFAWHPFSQGAVEDEAKQGVKLPPGLLLISNDTDRISADMLVKANAGKDKTKRPIMTFETGPDGKERYARIARTYAGGRIAVVINNEIYGLADLPPAPAPGSVPAPLLPPVLTSFTSEKQAKALAADINDSILKALPSSESRAFASADTVNVFRVNALGQLQMLDATNGRVKHQLDVKEFDVALRNDSGDGLVYLASSKEGYIACVKAK